MRVLFTFIAGAGHFYPLVSLAHALAGIGHDVAWATDVSFATQVEASGLRCFHAGMPVEDARELLKIPHLPPLAMREVAVRRLFPELLPSRLLPDLVALRATWAPDLVVSDNYEFAGRVAAESWGVAHASVKVGHIFPYGERHQLVPAMDALRARVGLPPDPDGAMLFRYLYLLNEPPQLQSAEEVLPPTTVRVRRVTFDQSGPEGRPDWLAALPERPTVYATMGTFANRFPGLLEALLAALREEPINLILTVGRDRDPAEFGPQPSNVHVERYIPQSLVLDACDLVVSHCGSGSMLAALDRGLPMVNIPIAADQPWNARRCAQARVGLTVDPEERTPEAIRTAARTVLSDPIYRQDAQRMRAAIRVLPGPETAVTLLERLAVENYPSTPYDPGSPDILMLD
jgi:UDP:flavonoid glycosyltransferase YjiC (YdhE family)